MQFKVLSILVTATAAVFVYLFKKDPHQIAFCACLIIPGIYAFFGTLWLDQVYRQRRLAAYIYEIETMIEFPRGQSEHIGKGWEHFVQVKKQQDELNTPKGKRPKDKLNTPSRYYYYICLGLFFAVPVAVYILACTYSKIGNVLSPTHELFLPACIGIVLYVLFIIFSFLYIRSIKALVSSFSSGNSGNADHAFIEDALAEAEAIASGKAMRSKP
jgi:hypothetical protein